VFPKYWIPPPPPTNITVGAGGTSPPGKQTAKERLFSGRTVAAVRALWRSLPAHVIPMTTPPTLPPRDVFAVDGNHVRAGPRTGGPRREGERAVPGTPRLVTPRGTVAATSPGSGRHALLLTVVARACRHAIRKHTGLVRGGGLSAYLSRWGWAMWTG